VVPDRQRIASALGREAASLTAAEVSTALWSAIECVNHGLEVCERIHRIAIFENDFPVAARSMSIFQKVNVDRAWVAAHYQQSIAAIYAGEPEGGRH
jgi:long-subunit acyl-CoA synthetase (AMP-forming)